MNQQLTPRQVLLLWCLLAKQGYAAQAAIVPAVDAGDRKKLEAAKMLKVTKGKRNSIWLQLEENGWGWAAEHLAAELPKAYGVLRDVFVRLDAHLAENGVVLADFIGSTPEPAPEPPETPARPGPAKKTVATRKKAPAASTNAPSANTPEGLRVMIERAYLTVTNGRKNREAPLAEIRAKLPGVDRATVDAGLRRILSGDAKARLIRINDPQAIREADAAAAFNPAGEPYHILWIME